MGPVNLKNPNFSFSVRFTVKNAILDRTFTRLSKFQLLDLELEFSISGQLPDSEFLFSRRDNSYFQFHRMPILMRYPITARINAGGAFSPTCRFMLCYVQFNSRLSSGLHHVYPTVKSKRNGLCHSHF